MRNPVGEKLDFEALEKRRLKAVNLMRKRDMPQADVARHLHVSRQTVSRWMKAFRAGGERALKKAGRAGRRPQLTEVEREILADLLLKDPQQLGYKTSVWTCATVADLIAEEFGIEYHLGHVWKILVQLGWKAHPQARRGRQPSPSRNPSIIRDSISKSSRISDDPDFSWKRLREILAKTKLRK